MRSRVQLGFSLLMILALLGLGDWVVCEAFTLAFDMSAAPSLILGAVLALLSAGFIAATVLGNYYYNFFTRGFYLVTATWMGAFLYFFFASVLYGIGVAILPSLVAAGPWLFLLVLCINLYGIVHARMIVITTVRLILPNLPQEWKGRKAVWISDLHLGQIHGSGFARRVVEQVEALAPDIVFVGGDLYDGTGAPDIPELTAPLAQLTARLGVYFVTGNHEEYGDQERFLSAVRGAGMRVLQDEMIVIDGLQLIGVDYKHASDPAQFKTILEKCGINPAMPSILLKHVPSHLDVAQAAGVSLQVSGHTHKGQQWPLVYVAKMSYKGFAYGLKKFKTMQVYISSGAGTWGPPVRVATHGEIVLFIFE